MSAPIWNARWLKAERVLRGFTQEDVAKASGLDVSTVASVERSDNAGVSSVVAYCYGLGTTVSEIVAKYGNGDVRATG